MAGKEEIPYVLGVACSAMIATAAGPRRADELAALVPVAAWQRLSCADGSKGSRLYDWAFMATASPDQWLLVRRSLRPGEKGQLELAFFRCYSPRPVALPSSSPSQAPDGPWRTASPRPGTRPAWTTTRSASTAPGTGMSPCPCLCPCLPTLSWLSPPAPPRPPRDGRNRVLPAGAPTAGLLKRGPDACGQVFAPPRTYTPQAFITDDHGRDLIPLTAGEARRLFNLHTHVTRPAHSTSTGQAGDATARPAPGNRTTHAGPEVSGRRCSTSVASRNVCPVTIWRSRSSSAWLFAR
jgi:hypothetical protein